MLALGFIGAAQVALSQSDIGLVWLHHTGIANGRFVSVTPLPGGDIAAVISDNQGSLARIQRIDPAGDVLWSTGIGAGSDIYISRVTPGPGSDLIVTGSVAEMNGSIPGALGDWDGYVARISAEGVLLSVQRFGGDMYDVVQEAEPDGQGGVYVLGTTLSPSFGGSGAPGSRASFVAHFDAAGTRAWVCRIDGGAHDLNLRTMVERAGGALEVVGNRWLVGSGPDPEQMRVSISLSGQVLATEYGQAGSWNGVYRVADGSILLAGDGRGSVGVTGLACRADASPGSAWCATQPDTGYTWSYGYDICADGVDGVVGVLYSCIDFSQAQSFVTGFRGLIRYSLDGQELERRTLRFSPCVVGVIQRIEIDEAGGHYAIVSRFDECTGTLFSDSVLVRLAALDPIASQVCQGMQNSTGREALTDLAGSDVRVRDTLTLHTEGLPPATTVLYLVAQASDSVPGAGGSQGTLCLGGSIGRFTRPGDVRVASAMGFAALDVELGAIPTPSGFVNATQGTTLVFQAWYRDNVAGPTSNFSSAAMVTLR